MGRAKEYILPRRNIKEEILKKVADGGRSINSIYKELNKEGIKMHRLVLTGYLRALADCGILKEMEIPPSKVYTPAKISEVEIYERIGKGVRKLKMREGKKSEVCLFILQKLFKRPIFYDELKRCGYPLPKNHIKADLKEVDEAKEILSNSLIFVEDESDAYKAKNDYYKEFCEVIGEILINQMMLTSLRMKMKQSRLL